ncbi:MAG TPA: DUF5655 domain-containing protein [Vicinamibacterales bacterium]|nr:DUF5655 domain-containing protein [Vicinamibacterales bacterium]
MAARTCFFCKEPLRPGESHDCWTTTEAALTRDLPEDLQDAWERLRETAAELGNQHIYASHHSIMFSRTTCYFFVRPRPKFLEVCLFLGRPVNAPQIRRVTPSSKTKYAHVLRVRHRDEVEAPLTDWLREAYALQDVVAADRAAAVRTRTTARAPARSSTPARVDATAHQAKARKPVRPGARRTSIHRRHKRGGTR